ncbi:MAG: SpoIIE family protein phosphatase [Bacteroidetes bacterium]|nr:SpoIIE family protein phosphatase [Bacteroidota bacterium]
MCLAYLAPHAQSLPLRVDYFPQDYNAYELNWAFVQDSHGRLYVGNNDGVLLFDGLRWQLLPTPTPVRALGLSPAGKVVVGCKNDFGYLAVAPNGKLRFISFRAELPAGALGTFEYVLGIYPQGDATIVVTREAVFRLVQAEGQPNKLQKLVGGIELIAAAVFSDRVCVISATGENRIIQGAKVAQAPLPGFPEDEIIVAAAPVAQTGTYLIATESNRIYRYSGGKALEMTLPYAGYLNSHIIYALNVSPNGKLVAIGTQTGGVVLADAQLQEIARLDGSYLPSPDVYAQYFDAQGGLWVAHAKGMSRLATDRPAYQLADEHQLGGKVLALAADAQGLWVGTTQGLFRIEQGNVTSQALLRGQEVWALQTAPSGATLVGSSGGLWLANTQGVTPLEERRPVYALADVGGGRIAYGGDRVVGAVNCSRESSSTVWRDTTQAIEVSSLVSDGNDGLWVGTTLNASMHRLPDGKWEKSANTQVALANGYTQVTSIAGKLWRIDQSGLFSISDNKAAALADYIPAGAQFIPTASDLWLSVGGKAPLRLVPDKDNLWDLSMPNPLAILGKSASAITGASQVLYAARQGAVYKVAHSDESPVVKVFVHRVLDQGADTLLAQFPWSEEHLAISYDSRNIALELGLSDLGNPAAIWVQYRLGDGKWSTLKSGGRIELGELSIGNNKIAIRVLDSYGRWADAEVFTVVLKAPWYLTIWGIALFILLAVGIIYLVFRLYVRRLHQQKVQLERIVAERTEEVEKQAETIREQNKDMLDSIRYAQRIQDVMLPQPDFLSAFFPENFVFFRPHSIVSGDFYWYFQYNDILWLAAADCTGHGVPGAMMSSIGINQLNVIVRQNPNAHTYEILNLLDAGIRNALKQDAGGNQMDGMDIALCKINLTTHQLEFTGANRPLYILRGQEILIHEADRSAIGGADVSAFSSRDIQLQPGDRVFMFSDGFPDQMGKTSKRRLGIRRVRTLLEETASGSLLQQHKRLEQELQEWQQDEEQTDDMLIMAWQVPA